MAAGDRQRHPLARHIVTTMTVNEVVNGAGITYPFRLAEEMAAGAADAIRAYTVTTEVFGAAVAVGRDRLHATTPIAAVDAERAEPAAPGGCSTGPPAGS